MVRRADPARIDAAHREATRQRLLSTGMLLDRVDALMAAWEDEALRRGLGVDYRYNDDAAWDWLVSKGR
jgi:hypothetical protein